MVRRSLWLLLALSIGLNLGLLYGRLVDQPMKRPPKNDGGPRGGMPVEKMIAEQVRMKTDHLQLDREQAAAVRAILEKRLPEVSRLREEAHIAQRDLARVFASEPFAPAAFVQQAAWAREVRSRADSVSALILLEEAGVMNAEQRRVFGQEGPLKEGPLKAGPLQDGHLQEGHFAGAAPPPPHPDGPPDEAPGPRRK